MTSTRTKMFYALALIAVSFVLVFIALQCASRFNSWPLLVPAAIYLHAGIRDFYHIIR